MEKTQREATLGSQGGTAGGTKTFNLDFEFLAPQNRGHTHLEYKLLNL